MTSFAIETVRGRYWSPLAGGTFEPHLRSKEMAKCFAEVLAMRRAQFEGTFLSVQYMTAELRHTRQWDLSRRGVCHAKHYEIGTILQPQHIRSRTNYSAFSGPWTTDRHQICKTTSKWMLSGYYW
jgi:hypothetical protein